MKTNKLILRGYAKEGCKPYRLKPRGKKLIVGWSLVALGMVPLVPDIIMLPGILIISGVPLIVRWKSLKNDIKTWRRLR